MMNACPVPATFAELELLEQAGFYEEPSDDCLPAAVLLARAMGGLPVDRERCPSHVNILAHRIQALANVLCAAQEGGVGESDSLLVLDTIADWARFMRAWDTRRHAEDATLITVEFTVQARELKKAWDRPGNEKATKRLERLLELAATA